MPVGSRIAIVCLAYFLAGWAGISLAIPPGFTAPIWPSAGIALASLLLYGPAMSIGIWLGSFLINFVNGMVRLPYELPIIDNMLLASMIATGALVGNLTAYALLRRMGPWPIRMEHPKELARFFFVIVPISCSLSAAIGAFALSALGVIPSNNIPMNWSTWWSGDLIGVAIVTPVVLSFLASPPVLWRPRRFYLSAAFMFISGLFVLLYFRSSGWYSDAIKTDFEKRSGVILQDIDMTFGDYENIFRSIEAFWLASELVTSREFQRYTNHYFLYFPALKEVAWAPYIEASFEEKYRQSFDISIQRCEGDASQRYSIPVTYRNVASLTALFHFGQDLKIACKHEQFPPLENVDGTLVYDIKLETTGDESKENCLFVVTPMRHSTADNRTNGISKSYLVGLMSLDKIIRRSFVRHGFEGLQLRIYGKYPNSNAQRLILQEPKGDHDVPPGYSRSLLAEIFGKQYSLLVTLPYTHLVAYPSGETCLVLVFGVVFSLVLMHLILTLTGENIRIETLVEKRTDELQEQKAKASYSSKMATLGLMVGGFAHEINNPLAIIQGYASLLIRRLRAENLPQDLLEKGLIQIEKTCLRISSIVHALGAYTKDSDPDRPILINVEELVHETLVLCEVSFREKGIKVELLNRGLGHPEVLANKASLMQVLMNILNNARDAVEPLKEKWIRITINDTDEVVEIGIADSGKGVLPEYRERLMQPFFTTKDVGKGTGLGLYVSKAIIEKLGGSLDLDENALHTTFVIQLPSAGSRQKALS